MAQANRQRYVKFKDDIHRTRPDFRPWDTEISSYPSDYLLGGDRGALSGPPITLMEVQEVIEKYVI